MAFSQYGGKEWSWSRVPPATRRQAVSRVRRPPAMHSAPFAMRFLRFSPLFELFALELLNLRHRNSIGRRRLGRVGGTKRVQKKRSGEKIAMHRTKEYLSFAKLGSLKKIVFVPILGRIGIDSVADGFRKTSRDR